VVGNFIARRRPDIAPGCQDENKSHCETALSLGTPGRILDHYDPAIDTFGLAIFDLEHDGIENAPQLHIPA
jgi:hypothetical protein